MSLKDLLWIALLSPGSSAAKCKGTAPLVSRGSDNHHGAASPKREASAPPMLSAQLSSRFAGEEIIVRDVQKPECAACKRTLTAVPPEGA